MNKPHIRELSVLEYRELYKLCDKYLHARFYRLLLPLCDYEDTLMDTVEDAYERIATKNEKIKNLKSFMKRVAFISAAKALEKRQYRRNLVWLDSMPLSTPNVNSENPDDEPEDYGFVLSDDGAGAEKIRRGAEARLDSRHPPLWLGLFHLAEKALKGKAKKVLSALKKDSRHVIAAEITGMSRQLFEYHIKKIRADFAFCYEVYREWKRRK